MAAAEEIRLGAAIAAVLSEKNQTCFPVTPDWFWSSIKHRGA